MIRIQPKSEPAHFDARVRQPGKLALAKGKKPKGSYSYWTRCLDDLWETYDGVCAYLSQYIEPGTGAPTVDHFIPKSVDQAQAYEWDNYRLACARLNSKKREFQDVLDPFQIRDDWFELDFHFMKLMPAAHLDATTTAKVQATIDRLHLNQERYRKCRKAYLALYRKHRDLSFLKQHSPFLAKELARQGLL